MHGDGRDDLVGEQTAASAEQQPGAAGDALGGDEPDHEGPDETTHEVDTDDVERVVVAQTVLERDGQSAGTACHQADAQRSDRLDGAAREVDGTEPLHDPAARATRERAVVLQDPEVEHPVRDREVDERRHRAAKTTHTPNFIRSATAPLMRATVSTANISWKPMKARSGRPAVTLSGARSSRPSSPLLKPNTRPFVAPKAMA